MLSLFSIHTLSVNLGDMKVKLGFINEPPLHEINATLYSIYKFVVNIGDMISNTNNYMT